MITYPPIAPDSIDVSVYFRAAQAATGTNPGDPVTVTAATPGISLNYRRRAAAAVPISLSDLSLLTDGHTDGGLLLVGAGLHRLDVPDAAFAAASDDVIIFGSATDIVIFGFLVPLGVPEASITGGSFDSSALQAIQSSVAAALTASGTATASDVLATQSAILAAVSSLSSFDPLTQEVLADLRRVRGRELTDNKPFDLA